jgi:Ulp1 family protease
VSKKTGKLIKPRKPIKFLKKPAGSVRFYKQKTKKTKSNRTETDKKQSQTEKTEQNRENRAKTGKTEPNWFEPVFALKKQTETGRFDPISVWFRFFF